MLVCVGVLCAKLYKRTRSAYSSIDYTKDHWHFRDNIDSNSLLKNNLVPSITVRILGQILSADRELVDAQIQLQSFRCFLRKE
jgi:hypothetical protein